MTQNRTQNQEPTERPWIDLRSSYDVEAWIDNYNYDLRRVIDQPDARLNGQGICFLLAHGGEIYMHTDTEGNVLLDVTPEAEWAAPVISAATGVAAPATQIWSLPSHVLTQLVFGLNSLIAATRIVTSHDFRLKKY